MCFHSWEVNAARTDGARGESRGRERAESISGRTCDFNKSSALPKASFDRNKRQEDVELSSCLVSARNLTDPAPCHRVVFYSCCSFCLTDTLLVPQSICKHFIQKVQEVIKMIFYAFIYFTVYYVSIKYLTESKFVAILHFYKSPKPEILY